MKKKIEKHDESEFCQPFVAESEFEVRYPSYREDYIKSNISKIEDTMSSKKLTLEIDYSTRTLLVKTNRKTCDPYIVVKGHQFLRLLCRGITLREASRVLEDDVFCEIVKVNNLVRNRKVLSNRKERLIGKNEAVMKALRLLTKCHVQIQGDTVACVGPYKGVQEVKHVVEMSMKNVHPVFLLKQLMAKRKLESDKNMKNESWDRYIPPIPKARKKQKTTIEKNKSMDKTESSMLTK
eukprot:jgi/Antlo1/2163/1749